MQRVRVGLTGLACVFLLVLLAAAFFGLTNNEHATGPLAVPEASGPSAGSNMIAAPREPLAELGVAPGFGTESAAAGTNTAMHIAPPAGPPPGAATAPAPPAAR